MIYLAFNQDTCDLLMIYLGCLGFSASLSNYLAITYSTYDSLTLLVIYL